MMKETKAKKPVDARRLLQRLVIFDLVRVSRVDSMGVTNTWENKDELEPLPPSSCDSVGFVVEATDQHLTICQSVSERQVLARLTIPAVAIQTVKKL